MRPSRLARRTPLRSGPARTAQPKRSKRVNPVSARRRAENETRRDVMLEVRARIYCEACPILTAAGIIPDPACRYPHHGRDGHEILSRARRGSPLDPTNIMWTCRPAHQWITTHPADAAHLGLLAPSQPL